MTRDHYMVRHHSFLKSGSQLQQAYLGRNTHRDHWDRVHAAAQKKMETARKQMLRQNARKNATVEAVPLMKVMVPAPKGRGNVDVSKNKT